MISDPQHTADRPVVVYDGHCPYCRRQVQRMQRRDPDGTFEYAPRQTEGLTDRFPQLDEGDFNTGMRLVETDGQVRVGADAVYHIARRLRTWRRFAWLYRVPGLRQLFRAAYAWIARNRYRLARKCEDEACAVAPASTDAADPQPSNDDARPGAEPRATSARSY